MNASQLQLSAETTQTPEIAQNAQDIPNAQTTENTPQKADELQGQVQGQEVEVEVEMDITRDSAANGGQTDTAQDLNAPTATSAQSTDAQPTDAPTAAKKNSSLGFLNYLTSPIVEIIVGQGENETTLTAHQTLLLESPSLAETVNKFSETEPRRIELPDEHVDAFGCFLQFQYTRDYTSKPTEGQDAKDSDDSGEQLLKHARVYTLAEKLGIPALKVLAHTKIHRVNSTPRGEIEYARYAYTHTSVDDVTLRKPIANFWATRSHILRHGVEEEFKRLCLDVPEFSYDVLALVLENKEKRGQDNKIESESGTRTSGRKRQRGGQ